MPPFAAGLGTAGPLLLLVHRPVADSVQLLGGECSSLPLERLDQARVLQLLQGHPARGHMAGREGGTVALSLWEWSGEVTCIKGCKVSIACTPHPLAPVPQNVHGSHEHARRPQGQHRGPALHHLLGGERGEGGEGVQHTAGMQATKLSFD